jgi:alanine racemase
MAAVIDINLAALGANLRAMRSQAPRAQVAAVVKADAYGLGLAGVLPTLACDSYFVARLCEGISLRALAPRARIFVFDGVQDDTVAALIAHKLIPVLGSLDDIARWQLARGGEAALQVDTGMNRLGLPSHELAVLAGEAQTRLQGITLALVMSHLACSDEPDSPMNAVQLARFGAALAQLPPAPASLAASGGIFLGADYHFDMVRPGIGLYGGNPHPGHANPMQPVVRLAAPILQLRPIAPGETVGYGGSFTADRPMTIATIALGYADGVLRAASGRARSMIHGRVVPIVGWVSMDLITLDVTGLDAGVGDMAELFGPALPLDEAAAAWGTISYELLTGLSRRIPRVYQDA